MGWLVLRERRTSRCVLRVQRARFRQTCTPREGIAPAGIAVHSLEALVDELDAVVWVAVSAPKAADVRAVDEEARDSFRNLDIVAE